MANDPKKLTDARIPELTAAYHDDWMYGVRSSLGTAGSYKITPQNLLKTYDVTMYGAVGDGATDDTAAIRAAMTAAQNSQLYIPNGTYKISSEIDIPSPIVIHFQSKSAVLAYTGNGSALKIGNEKNISIHSGTVDLSGAGTDAAAWHIRGLWHVSWYDPCVICKDSSLQTAFKIETSETGGDGWGSFILHFYNPYIFRGHYGIRTLRTAGDSVHVTHLHVHGGYMSGVDYGIYLEETATGSIIGTAIEQGDNDGIYIGVNATDLILMPGEINNMGGYGINISQTTGRGNYLIAPSAVSFGTNALGDINETAKINIFDRGRLQLVQSRAENDYYVELKSLYNYGESFVLNACGGGSEAKLLSWGTGKALTPGTGLALKGATGIMTGNEVFNALSGNVFVKDPNGIARNFNPLGVFQNGHLIILVNTASDATAITFDSTGLNQAVAQNQRGIFVYDGTAWRKVFVG